MQNKVSDLPFMMQKEVMAEVWLKTWDMQYQEVYLEIDGPVLVCFVGDSWEVQKKRTPSENVGWIFPSGRGCVKVSSQARPGQAEFLSFHTWPWSWTNATVPFSVTKLAAESASQPFQAHLQPQAAGMPWQQPQSALASLAFAALWFSWLLTWPWS